MDDLWERFHIEVDKGQTPVRIDKYLTEHMAGTSRNRIQAAADSGQITVNGTPVRSNYKVKPLDDIRILLDHEPIDTTITPENIPLTVVYEDDDLMVQKNTSLDINNPDIGLVHRIDKDTSGLLLIAKTPDAKTHLGQQFFDHTTERTYQALVWGTFREQQGTVTGALARDNSDRTKYRIWSLEDNPDAKHAVTHWQVVESFPYVTLVECRLETGRTHQIRVHMQSLGHPLFNDEKYGGTEILKGLPTQKYKQFIHNCFLLCPRQALHAKTLGFTHPKTGERMFFDSDLPEDMSNLLNKWRNYGTYSQTDTMG